VTAGPCLASCYELSDKILIVVLLKTTKLSRRFKDARLIVGLTLRKLDKVGHKERIKQVLQNDPELDSDNSEDEEAFNYDKTDAKEMVRRNKILTFEM
jgi:D-alanyl-D-alanine carboxypeptidase